MSDLEVIFSPHGLAVLALTGGIVLACVLLHYEAFGLLQKLLGRLHIHVRRRRVLLLMLGLLLLHISEIWLFGLGYYVLTDNGGPSFLQGAQRGGVLECIYFSAIIYTTLGLGDLVPIGPIRFLTGTEALTGFLLITWSASFTFLQMEKYWRV